MINANQHQIFRSVDAIDFAPRFGFAWSPGGSDKTVVRGGFGIFYDAFPAVLGDSFMTNLPTVRVLRRFDSLRSPTPWADQTNPTGPWVIGQTTANQIRNGFASGASYNSLSTANPLFTSPSFNNMLGHSTFRATRNGACNWSSSWIARAR